MPKCFYGFKDTEQTTFNNREHVIPQSLGTFSPLNPLFKGDLVCDKCNHSFSPLEANFNEDSEEGIYGQMLNIEGSNSVRLRGKNVKLKFDSGLGSDFLNNIFPFLKRMEDKLVIEIKPQVHLKNYEGVYQIFLPEALKKIKKDTGNFKRVKDRISKLDKKDIRIFAGANQENDNANLSEIVTLMKDFGIDYKEKEKQFSKFEDRKDNQFGVEMECTVNAEVGRVLAKIAFNYFAYCAEQDQRQDILFGAWFNKIRNFINGDKAVPLKDIVISVDKDVILDEERNRKHRLLAHIIVFEKVNGNIIARETFWGKRVYEIAIGQFPNSLDFLNFGCGHAFDPFRKNLYNLSQQPKLEMTEADIRATFGLFKKIR